ncbi:MAG TPA: strawberry notch family protein, partial [bacterium]|nr:strawberry notch family protein [bacterium]
MGDTGSSVVPPADRNRTETLNVEQRERERTQEELSDDKIFDTYAPQQSVKGAKPHPGKLEESAAMAAVEMPKADYRPSLPKEIIEKGLLSDAQIEAVIYAGNAHRQVAPEGTRRGFFIGDGTGVGKGREIAAIILDNWNQGRKKAVWVTQNQPLINDAQRDVAGIGWDPNVLIDFGKTKFGTNIKNDEGIAFLGYTLLATKSKDSKKKDTQPDGGIGDPGASRLNQLACWLGSDFDGVIVFDESHNMGNAVGIKGLRGTRKPSQKALTGVKLQTFFPNARIVYVSATGATEVSNLSYCDRLGLWGRGKSFADKLDFINRIAGAGIAAMEMVAQNLKAMGRYMARSLSFDGVKYAHLEHPLTDEQRIAYDKCAEAWQIVLENIHRALDVTNGGKRQRANAMSAFWGSNQRFFNQIITSMQMPTIIKAIEQDLAEGYAPVLQLTNTNEAQLDRALQGKGEEEDIEDLDLTPLEQLMGYVERSFPVHQYTEVMDEEGNVHTEPVYDSDGNHVTNPAAEAMRDQLLSDLESLKNFIPEGALDMVINHFGHDKVAEVTGRSKRIITVEDAEGSRRKVEKWSKARSLADADQFQNDKKSILVFSQAGGTGRSYHADLTAKNQRLRKHYLVQAGWRADVAVQGFGRSHRSNQKQPPEYVLVMTDLKGQKRFISSIARRLDQLGALTKGQRQTGSSGFFGAEDNLETLHAHYALGDLIKDVFDGQVPDLTMEEFERQTGLKFTDSDGNLLRNPVPEMPRFLNRILNMTIDVQNRVFDLFHERLLRRLEIAKATGTLDVGVETIRAKRIEKLQEVTVHVDEESGAETKYMEFELTNDAPMLSFDVSANYAKGGYVRNNRSGRVYAVSNTRHRTDAATGNVMQVVGLMGANYNEHTVPTMELNDPDKYTRLSGAEAAELWEAEYKALPSETKSRRHLVTGALLPIWDRLPDEQPRIFRLKTADGTKYIGRVIPERQLQRTLDRLGATATAQHFSPSEVFQAAYDAGREFTLANDWKIKRRRVSGEWRLELIGPFFHYDKMLKELGVFIERIQGKVRYFIPAHPTQGAKTIEGILSHSPVVKSREGLTSEGDG